MRTRGERGAVMIVVVGFLTVLMMLGAGYLYAVRRQAQAGDNHRLSLQLLHTAEAGARRALARLAADTGWRTGFADEPFEGGQYGVAVAGSGDDVQIVAKARLAGLARTVVVDAETRPGVYEPFTCILFAEGDIAFNVPWDPGGDGGPAEVRGAVASLGAIAYDPAEIAVFGDESPGAAFDAVDVDLSGFRALAEGAGTYYAGPQRLCGNHRDGDVVFVDGDVVVCNWAWDGSRWDGVATRMRTVVADGNVEIATWGDSRVEFDPNVVGGIRRPAIVCTGHLAQRIYVCPDPAAAMPEPAAPGGYGNDDTAPIRLTGIVYAKGDVEFAWIRETCALRTIVYAGGDMRICLRRDARLEYAAMHADGVRTYPAAFDGVEVGGSVRVTAWR